MTPRLRALENHPDQWLQVRPKGLYCVPGDFYIDPHGKVDRAVITHGHADHARAGHGHVLTSPETAAIMRVRYGKNCAGAFQELVPGTGIDHFGVRVQLVPAGHVLGSCQIVLDYAGWRVVASGDYKRASDPTSANFEVVACDVFITEATFGLPVFVHEHAPDEIAKLIGSLDTFPERSHLMSAYSLGKAQRLIAELRAAGYDAPIYLHSAHERLCRLYQDWGVNLGVLYRTEQASKDDLRGGIILAPPSSSREGWADALTDTLPCAASGWMRVRKRAQQSGAELPLVISDHADWPDLQRTILDTGAEEIWVTHGREEALVYFCETQGLRGRALALIGREGDGE